MLNLAEISGDQSLVNIHSHLRIAKVLCLAGDIQYKPWNASSYEINGNYSVTLVLADNYDAVVTKAMPIHNIESKCHIERLESCRTC